eukprot:TRINITY_DN17208_c0_g1_i2.p1 TRINITY_DN17208_c0_g1~~TRINITY_DN17208_c0_g1_i2.p1  ORF type:complete len:277 (+),score=30.84 TRINITY_DN17208_c0_g1_i2:55-885(+)
MALFADGFPSVFGRKKQTDPAFVASHSGRMDNHDRGVPDWILKVPIDVAQIMERDKITVRTPQEVLWTMKTGIYAARSKSPGLLFPTPFQDFVDRPEYFFGSALVGGFSVGSMIGFKKGILLAASGSKSLTATQAIYGSIIYESVRMVGNFLVLGAAFLAGDRLVMSLKRDIATRQGTLTPENDVTRTTLNYTVGGAVAGGCFPWMDAHRKTNMLRNFVVWSTYGAAMFTFFGLLVTSLVKQSAIDLTDEKAFRTFTHRIEESARLQLAVTGDTSK